MKYFKILTLKQNLGQAIDKFGLPEILDRLIEHCYEQTELDKAHEAEWKKIIILFEKALRESLDIANSTLELRNCLTNETSGKTRKIHSNDRG